MSNSAKNPRGIGAFASLKNTNLTFFQRGKLSDSARNPRGIAVFAPLKNTNFREKKEFQLLNDSLNHILRNSLDHGIEDYTSREKEIKIGLFPSESMLRKF